jgi:hypothetical protein
VSPAADSSGRGFAGSNSAFIRRSNETGVISDDASRDPTALDGDNVPAPLFQIQTNGDKLLPV